MNNADLLDQFVVEARECLETIGKRLLDVERDPHNSELLNDLFRSVHTLKGNCGLFEFKPLERVVHAGEDLLDRVRHHTLDYTAQLADVLLEAMDYSAQLIDQIERDGRIADGAEARSIQHAHELRALLGDGAPVLPVAAAVPNRVAPKPPVDASAMVEEAASAVPGWVARLGESTAGAACTPGAAGTVDSCAVSGWALHYRPEPGCFFKGEDPWRLACTTPGLLALDVAGQQPWPVGADLRDWDCYQCNLDIVLLSSADRAELDVHFRCVPEQLSWHSIVLGVPAAGHESASNAVMGDAVSTALLHPPLPGKPVATDQPAAGNTGPDLLPTRLLARVSALWTDQQVLLQRALSAPGTLASVRRSLRGLLVALDDAIALSALDELSPGASPADLLAWSILHAPAAEPVGKADADVDAYADTDVAVNVDATLAIDIDSPRGDQAGTANQPQRVLKVSQDKVDRLMDLIGEMVVAKNSLPYLAQRAETVFGQIELAREIKAQYAVVNRIAEDMQHAIMQVRMLPVGTVFQRFGRLVRDLSRRLAKQVQLVIEGEETEADKNVIESLADPLIHILRNSLDHGIELPEVRRAAGKPEVGTIHITARQESDRVIIEIADDGAGIDAARVRAVAIERGLIPADRAATLSDVDAVQLIFLPGFSTMDKVSDLSGRGVGMDVVRSAVEQVNGAVELSSRAGLGTTIRLSLPLSMAVTNVMVIDSAGHRLGVPMDLIVETVRVHVDDIHHFKHARTTVLRGRIVALRALNELLGLEQAPLVNADGELAVLVVRVGSETVGLLVDHFRGASDIILKPLDGVLAGLTGFAGSALMGDGGVLMVLNPKELLS